ncbi:hypothetical protein PR048_000007 [Dryococelus australis]|uniref:Uncharacterized protein n=1 Tax=Dryococelus australis TaxID=614101 RepID=A0ABQ9IEQ2_9NEOP|nr:hypothetical protein PR048_000007 [Dryococelus australis]
METEEITSGFSQLEAALNQQASENNILQLKIYKQFVHHVQILTVREISVVVQHSADRKKTTLKESRLAAMAIFAFEDLC